MKLNPNEIKQVKRSGQKTDKRILKYVEELAEAGAIGINIADLPPGRTGKHMSILSVHAAIKRELQRIGMSGKLAMYTAEKHPEVCNEHNCDIIIVRNG